MSLTPREQAILDRYVERTKQWAIEQNNSNSNDDVTPDETSDSTTSNQTKKIINPNIEEIIQYKKTYFSNETKDNINIGVAKALEEALKKSKYVVTMPELIATKTKLTTTDNKGNTVRDSAHEFWSEWYAVHTEENIGIDTKGIFYKKGEPVLILVNGGGLLTPERILKAYTDGLIDGSAKYEQQEFDNLLKGKLANGQSLNNIYTYEEIEKGVSNLPHQFGIVMPYSKAQQTNLEYYKKDRFINNPLVIARAAGLECLQKYHILAKDSDGDVGNFHPFSGRDPKIPQGCVLFLYGNYNGLSGNFNLSTSGRFAGVRTGGSP